MMYHNLALIVALGSFVGCSVSSGDDSPSAGDRPVQEIEWLGQGGGFQEWGQTEKGFLGISVKPEVLDLWKWNGRTLEKELIVEMPRLLNICIDKHVRYLASVSPGNKHGPWPLVLRSLKTQEEIKKWDPPAGWGYNPSGMSRNGEFGAITLYPESEVRDGQRLRVGLIDMSTLGLRWVGEVTGHGVNTVRQIAVSDAGKYVAVGGWNNGIALVDATAEKVLWNQRPPKEVSTGYVVFASDGLTLYSGGGEGCVYALETKTGKILRQWYATPTGESVYAHRISCLAISPDDAWVAAGTGPEGQVYLVNVKSNEKPRMLPHGLTTTMLVSFSPDSQHLATVGGGRIKIWSVKR